MTYATSVRLDEETKALLNEVATFRDRSPHWIMKKAIEQYLLSESEEMRYLREGIEGLESAQRTGEFSTIEDLKTWADQLGTSEEQQLPHVRRIK